ncbi:hypothetical protein DNU06_08005 [Putridiphycobacter roseus]|uniref:DUF1572 domain-containing protein n=1 Tax=Putridiphycobacter roseus TaxID=2219161 RepID=A0A2W1MZ74_9FLAO|nr:DUF1572 family protein [Putridiphycobacter roseus]PZE17207.1 hypothetical protein DNU06_08005 [Putridiphycobacter roseus]
MDSYLESVKKQFTYYKTLGEKTIAQVPSDKLAWQLNEESNSIAMLVKHLNGNMLSRWTNFLDEDGEKTWRKRDEEFDNDLKEKEALMVQWEAGWQCLFEAINPLTEVDLEKIVYIRNMGHTVTEAINRQLPHYAYHIGQIVFIGKIIQNQKWHSLSIPKGKSKDYNQEKFDKPKQRKHFTDDL